jgi:hypothetical protein
MMVNRHGWISYGVAGAIAAVAVATGVLLHANRREPAAPASPLAEASPVRHLRISMRHTIPVHPSAESSKLYCDTAQPRLPVDLTRDLSHAAGLTARVSPIGIAQPQHEIHPTTHYALSAEDRARPYEQVERETKHLIEMLTAKYALTPRQQTRALAMLARASNAYHPSIGASIGAPSASAGTTALQLPSVASEVAEQPPGEQGPTATEVPAAALTGVADASGEAVYSLDDLEARIAPLLDDAQLTLVDEDQVDRYYWWSDVLDQIDDDLDAATAAGAALWLGSVEETTTVAATTPAATAPSAHQGGNLLQLITSEP